jgi:predicted CoA-binding protein
MMNIEQFLASRAFAVIGASNNREKFGNKVLRCYISHKRVVYPIHPIEKEVEHIKCLKSVAELPETVESISIVTPPLLTEKIIGQAITKGIKNIWMQPGASSQAAIEKCIKNGINVIADGPCILVELGCG